MPTITVCDDIFGSEYLTSYSQPEEAYVDLLRSYYRVYKKVFALVLQRNRVW